MSDQNSNKLVVVGSVAVDWVITPTAEREESVGGAAVFFAMAASPLTPVQLVGVVGHDFPAAALGDLERAGVDLDGLERNSDGLTFRWKGRYHENMNQRDTLETHLNVFENFSPRLPPSYRESEFLFLANIQPSLQLDVLDQMAKRPRLVGLDTMNLWIDIAHDKLLEVLARVDVLAINEEEALQLTSETNLVRAANKIRELGPKTLVIKRGEYGALCFGPDNALFAAPAMPLEDVVDPTGAGDSFAGGFMGHLARTGEITDDYVRQAVIWGSTMASYCVQGFSYDQLRGLSREDIEGRYQSFVELTRF
ncbi:2-dehydro-3-deoxygluconokinase [Enhygromyxa salina]|uniref:2-dehydro-3-deoxygluconokinase n=1 Tax=Enhygromyxa salina TaxID=215803 RepID=A0A2S9YL33_9BACT|nr:PfkB family carbohydrate kinase [Enhygromyxa salina]PRQ05825.1 2-dehydro-3-deoxygluconokinase [Enhygromyxa salina]